MAATDTTSTADVFEEETIGKWESVRLKNLAEQTYTSSDLKSALKYAKRAHRLCPTLDGISETLTAFKILTTAKATTTPHWYKILEVEPFSHINLIKKQYKKLALILHPDKNATVASEEAFKVVNEAFSVLNDKIRRKEYDMKLRIDMLTAVELDGGVVALDAFWTACSSCRLLHQFERKYLGHNLMCPNCKKSFKAVEVDDCKKVHTDVVDDDDDDGNGDDDKILTQSDLKRKMSSVGDIMKRSEQKSKKIDGSKNGDVSKRLRVVNNAVSKGNKVRNNEKLKEDWKIMNDDDDDEEEMMKIDGSKNGDVSKRLRVVNNAVCKGNKVRNNEKLKEDWKIMNDDDDDEEEMMTLAEMRKLVNDDVDDDDDKETMTQAEMQKLANDDDDDDNDENMTLAEIQKLVNDDEEEDEEMMTLSEMKRLVKINVNGGKMKLNKKDKAQRSGSASSNSKNKADGEGKNQDTDMMTVEDSDFYDFDEGRVEKSFKKGQIWALYDDDDGMPRHYGLIDEVVSTHPFEVNMSWLDPQIDGDEMLINLERAGFHITCGRFKVSKKTSVTSLNVFSHIVNCERAARDVYRIYPKKGSVWALYNEHVERGSQLDRDKRRYDIVVFLTSYSEVHGLSMGYLEKANGFKTTFRRREIGCHAIKWLEKHEVRLFSHQIPARKLSREEVPNLSGDCWELDPASLPTQLLTTRWKK